MTNWYGIPEIELHFVNPWADFEITFDGIRDSSGVTVEDTMWSMYTDEFPEPDYFGDHYPAYADRFADYMRENADEVKDLIRMARGQFEY